MMVGRLYSFWGYVKLPGSNLAKFLGIPYLVGNIKVLNFYSTARNGGVSQSFHDFGRIFKKKEGPLRWLVVFCFSLNFGEYNYIDMHRCLEYLPTCGLN